MRKLKIVIGDCWAGASAGDHSVGLPFGPVEEVLRAFLREVLRGCGIEEPRQSPGNVEAKKARWVAKAAGLDPAQLAALVSVVEATGRTPPLLRTRALRGGIVEYHLDAENMGAWLWGEQKALAARTLDEARAPSRCTDAEA